MTLLSRMVFPLLVILALALGAESYTRMRGMEDLHQQIQGLAAQVNRVSSTATTATAAAQDAANKAAAMADRARASLAEARQIVDQVASQGALPKAVPPVVADMMTGKAIATLVCAACHVVSPDQTMEPVLQPPAPNFQEIARQPSTTNAGLRAFLARPHGPHEKMPSQDLTDSQVTLLVDYILSLRSQPLPR